MAEADLRKDLRQIELFPHQVEFIEAALALEPPARILLADDLGLGKTHACAALVWAWQLKTGYRPRFLVVTPAVLTRQWALRLEQLGVLDLIRVDAQEFRRLEARTASDVNPWGAVDSVIATADFLKRDDRLDQLLQMPWDLIVFDEAHLGTQRSQRGRVLRRLWDSDHVGLMVAATTTPRVGTEDFEMFTSPGTLVFRRSAEQLLDWDGTPVLGREVERRTEIVAVALSPEETELFDTLRSTLRADDDSKSPVASFGARAILRVASSSIFALEQSLRRASLPVEPEGPLVSAGGRALNEPEGVDLDSVDASAAMEESDVGVAPIGAADLRRLLDLIDDIAVDSKWVACEAVLTGHFEAGGRCAVVFTEFGSTAVYITSLLRDIGITTWMATGSTAAEGRTEAIAALQDEGGVLVITSAASEGLSLSFVKLCIHFDVPSSPEVFAQRLGRFHRLGAPPGLVRHVCFTDGVFTLDRVVEKIFSLKSYLGDTDGDDFSLGTIGSTTSGDTTEL